MARLRDVAAAGTVLVPELHECWLEDWVGADEWPAPHEATAPDDVALWRAVRAWNRWRAARRAYETEHDVRLAPAAWGSWPKSREYEDRQIDPRRLLRGDGRGAR